MSELLLFRVPNLHRLLKVQKGLLRWNRDVVGNLQTRTNPFRSQFELDDREALWSRGGNKA